MKKIHLIILSLSLLIVSCSSFTDGINTDPNEFTDSPGNLLIGQSNLAVVKLSESQASRVSGMWTDQFTGSDRQYIPLNNYKTTAGDFNDEWEDIYVNGIAQARLAETKGIESGDIILTGVSQIIQGLLLAETAALWGAIPESQALQPVAFPNPEYDSQTTVLNRAQNLLSDGISNVGSTSISVYGSPVYVGNDATWAEVAHSLKARYYLITKNYPMAYSESLLGISSASGDLLANHTSAIGSQNLYFQFLIRLREGYLTADGPSNLHNLLSGASPRLLATPGDSNRFPIYFDDFNLNTASGSYFAEDATFPIVSYLETKLIQAEANQRVNSGNAGQAEFNDIRAYLEGVYGVGFPATASTGNTLINEILEERYVSMPGSLQIFHDARRTNNALNIPIKSSTTTSLPQRFLYPQTEIGANSNFPGLEGLFSKTEVNQ